MNTNQDISNMNAVLKDIKDGKTSIIILAKNLVMKR